MPTDIVMHACTQFAYGMADSRLWASAGSTDGIGLHTATRLAAAGGNVIIHGRCDLDVTHQKYLQCAACCFTAICCTASPLSRYRFRLSMCLWLPTFPAKLPATVHMKAAGKLTPVCSEL